jgi:hypothetical protein
MEQNYSPWPADGHRVRFQCRRATWALARPWYGANNVRHELKELRWLSPITFWFPFVSVRTRFIHFYIGWKPITLDDPAFYWRDLDWARELRAIGRQFVQLSARGGFGAIS